MRNICQDPPRSNEWKAERQLGVTATEISAILGENPWMTSLQVWEGKKGLGAEFEDNQRMRIGRLLEPSVIALAEDNHGPVSVYPEIPSISGWDKDALMRASLDGMDGTGHPVEAKVTSQHWDEPPTHYIDQVLWQCGVVGAEFGTLAVLRGTEYDEYHIRFDVDWWEWATAEARRWWVDHIVGDEPPPASVGDDMTGMFTPDAEETIEVDAGAWAAYLEARDVEREATAIRKSLEIELQERVGSATKMLIGGVSVGTWRASKGRRSLDRKALAAAGLLDQFMVTGRAGRTWRIK